MIIESGAARLPPEGQVVGFDSLAELAASVGLEELAAICDVPGDLIAEAAGRFAAAPAGFAFAATGPALGRNGVLTHWLTLALNLITDRVDRAGGRFMPNWPVNAAINKAKAPPSPRIHSRVRGLPPVVGQHSVAELADEILTPGEGQIRALILGGGNPVSTAADGARLDAAPWRRNDQRLVRVQVHGPRARQRDVRSEVRNEEMLADCRGGGAQRVLAAEQLYEHRVDRGQVVDPAEPRH